mmetsp:Transcript_74547/g.198018  ORF Transcript_74547/g.198018 Transcript_74547/m.198018 type:complete len:358 (-) Transcript_74547:69-1142(-)
MASKALASAPVLLAVAQALCWWDSGREFDDLRASDVTEAGTIDLSNFDWSSVHDADAADMMRCAWKGGHAKCKEDILKPEDIVQRYKDFDESFAGTYQAHFASHERATYMIMAEAREIPLLKNALAHLADVQHRTQADMMTTIVALDTEVQEVCQSYSLTLQGRIDCVNLTGWMPGRVLGNISNCFGSAPYKFVISMKPFLLYKALEASRFGILNMDADVVVRDDLLGYVQKESAVRGQSIVASVESATNASNTEVVWTNRTNTGVLYAMPRALRIINGWRNAMAGRDWGRLGDQAAFNYLRRHFPLINASVDSIPIGMVAGGGWKAVYAGHYNSCGLTVAEKIDFMKVNGEWHGSA